MGKPKKDNNLPETPKTQPMVKPNKKKRRTSSSGIGNGGGEPARSEKRRPSGSTCVSVEQATTGTVDNSATNSVNQDSLFSKNKEWLERSSAATITIEDPEVCTMCACYHKIHWSVVSIAVNIVALVLFTTAVATKNWGIKSYDNPNYDVTTGLFQSCSSLNDTCYDTHTFFSGHDEKGFLMASAVICAFALIGMWMFFALAIFFLCGWFGEKQLTNGAIIASYLSGLLAVLGMIIYAVSIKSLDFSLSWSFILAVLGFCVNIAAGVLMCVGRNISTKGRKKQRAAEGSNPRRPVEEVQMEEAETTRKKVWATGGDPETSVKSSAISAGASNY